MKVRRWIERSIQVQERFLPSFEAEPWAVQCDTERRGTIQGGTIIAMHNRHSIYLSMMQGRFFEAPSGGALRCAGVQGRMGSLCGLECSMHASPEASVLSRKGTYSRWKECARVGLVYS